MRLPGLFLAVLLLFSCGDNLPGIPPNSLAALIEEDPDLQSFEDLLVDAGLFDSLARDGQWAVFAPSNEAISLLSQSFPDATPDELQALVKYHLHEGQVEPDTIDRRTALTTLDGRDIHIRLTLDGLTFDDGVRLSAEAIRADNGTLFLIDRVLDRALVTEKRSFESAPNALLDYNEEFGVSFFSDEIVINETASIHELQVSINLEIEDVSRLSVRLTHEETERSFLLAEGIPSRGENMFLRFSDGANSDIIDDANFEFEEQYPAYLGTNYRPAVPLEVAVGEELFGTWRLTVVDRRPEQETIGRLRSWGIQVAAGQQPPAPAIAIDRRRLPDRVFGLGFSEEVDVQAFRLGDLDGAFSISGQAGAAGELLSSEERTLGETRSFGSLVFEVPEELSMTEARATAVARIGDVSRVAPFDIRFAEPDRQGISLLAHIPRRELDAEGFTGSDIWGWTDPLTGAEIALMTTAIGTTFVDVSTPAEPRILGTLATQSFASDWRDVKVYRDHAYIVSEAPQHGLQIFDLTELRGIEAPQSFSATEHIGVFGNAHNIAINEESGLAYVVGSDFFECSGGLLVFDLGNPVAPVVQSCFSGKAPAGEIPGPRYPTDVYVHDVQCVIYSGPDAEHQGKEICISSDEDSLGISDFSDPTAGKQIARAHYESVGYTHQGWLTEDQRYFVLNDEIDELIQQSSTVSYVWDLADLDDPTLVGLIRNPRDAVGHNTYIKGDIAYQANYTSGLRLVDLSQIDQGTGEEMAFYDTYPDDDLSDGRNGFSARCRRAHPELESEQATNSCGYAAFQGAWSSYPFFDSGTIVVSDIDRGLFVLQRD